MQIECISNQQMLQLQVLNWNRWYNELKNTKYDDGNETTTSDLYYQLPKATEILIRNHANEDKTCCRCQTLIKDKDGM